MKKIILLCVLILAQVSQLNAADKVTPFIKSAIAKKSKDNLLLKVRTKNVKYTTVSTYSNNQLITKDEVFSKNVKKLIVDAVPGDYVFNIKAYNDLGSFVSQTLNFTQIEDLSEIRSAKARFSSDDLKLSVSSKKTEYITVSTYKDNQLLTKDEKFTNKVKKLITDAVPGEYKFNITAYNKFDTPTSKELSYTVIEKLPEIRSAKAKLSSDNIKLSVKSKNVEYITVSTYKNNQLLTKDEKFTNKVNKLISNASSGIYKFNIKAYNKFGTSITEEITITVVGSKEIAPIIIATAKLEGNILNLNAKSSFDPDGGNITSVKWEIYKDGIKFATLMGASQTYYNMQAGDYKIIVFVTDDESQVSQTTINFKLSQEESGADENNEGTEDESDNGENSSDKNNTNDSTGKYTLGNNADPISNPITEEYNAGNFLEYIGAHKAYEQGWNGTGVKVGIIDTGIDGDHKEFNEPEIVDISLNGDEDTHGHGTHVSGIVAAKKDGSGMHGVAYNADIISYNANNGYGGFAMDDVTDAVKLASLSDVKVLNLSLGGYSSYGYSTFGDRYREALESDTSIIVASGNDGDLDPAYPAALPTLSGFEDLVDLEGAFIAVGAVDNNNKIASYSNRAGNSKNWFICAPGGKGGSTISSYEDIIYSTYLNNGYNHLRGTSMASPVVTGVFALLSHKYPNLTGSEIRDIIFETATDLGAVGIDTVYGHGVINVEAAMNWTPNN